MATDIMKTAAVTRFPVPRDDAMCRYTLCLTPEDPRLATSTPATALHSSSGFSLVEVLVAVFVFAIGMLGMGALQLVSKQAGAEASQRTIAAAAAFELLERMRLNSHSLISATSPLATYLTAGADLTASSLTGWTVTNCTTINCTTSELANFDLHRVLGVLNGSPEMRGTTSVGGVVDPTLCVTGPANGESGEYRVTVAWRGKAAMTDAHDGNSCGQGRYGTNDEFRRILVLSTYIAHSHD
ncbi:type IV pilus modification protein PilV [Methylotetracoccus oryzae]|uniref:type IV pilus modification protein PilV n=1 Tax=Methylotetracoccus oryzae TaxID=1919059 RepID=UPI0013A5A333|nr:type IV pilus modification protein PilV [Methylotetracoccus oryzae]